MEFRKSELRDIPEMVGIINDAVAFLRDSGVNQWQDGYPNEAVLKNDIALGRSYVLTDGGSVVGTVVLSFEKDHCYDDIDGKWLNDEPYAVIHRSAVSAKARGKGCGRRLYEECERLAAQNGFMNIRVDTHRDNKVMNTMLTQYGYTMCGTIFVDTAEFDAIRNAYQKILK